MCSSLYFGLENGFLRRVNLAMNAAKNRERKRKKKETILLASK
jgi:hypothetical protein